MPHEEPAGTASTAKTTADAARDPHRIQLHSNMIASNIDPAERVAPALDKMSVINGLYAFADRLRAGSGGR